MNAYEVNFDGLIGPTHNYSGLSAGNIASQTHAAMVSYPKQAALQGIQKMRTLHQLGFKQGFFPPQLRPDFSLAYQLGFSGSLEELLGKIAQEQPELLGMIYSASSMWAANAATVTPSADAPDGKVHFTPANLITTVHRAIECQQTHKALATMFSDADKFVVHTPITAHSRFGDEGAANHNRLCQGYANQGVGLFVYGQAEGGTGPVTYPARQTLAASRAVARQHGVLERSVFLQQNPLAIDAGAFHNDVVAVANGPVLFYHEQAFTEDSKSQAFAKLADVIPGFQGICVPAQQVNLSDAISSYLFNSQLVATPTGDMSEMSLVAPMECAENPAVREYLESLSRDDSQPIRDVVFVDVRQSMSNGGGPACLRLRVVLTEQELGAVDERFLVNDHVLDQLEGWVKDFYRDELSPKDLEEVSLVDESYRALKALEVTLGIEGFYAF